MAGAKAPGRSDARRLDGGLRTTAPLISVGSLFSGIGGFDLGLENAGMEVVWQVERDELRRAVLAHHWPDVERHDDVRSVSASRLPPVELICGGFPCTDLSFAGRGAGIVGRHSGLWREFARIVRAFRPRWVVLENVPGIRSRGLDVVLGDLAASGYDAEWDCVPASALGAPHRRDRVWLVAYPGRERVERERADRELGSPPRDDASEGLQRQRSGDAARPSGEAALADAESGAGGPRRGSPDAPRLRWGRLVYGGRRRSRSWWSVEPDVGRVADGIPARLDRLSALGDSLVPQIAEAIGDEIIRYEREPR